VSSIKTIVFVKQLLSQWYISNTVSAFYKLGTKPEVNLWLPLSSCHKFIIMYSLDGDAK